MPLDLMSSLPWATTAIILTADTTTEMCASQATVCGRTTVRQGAAGKTPAAGLQTVQHLFLPGSGGS